jgi:hydrogenase expression/formation protein HypD
VNRPPEDYARQLHELAGSRQRRIQLMEVCGTHTVAVFRHGLRSLLPPQVRLISGPGCPVCVTAQRHIDAAIELATREGVILATYGDMLRVPGRRGSLERLRAEGAQVRVVGSARGALELARDSPEQTVVFLGVGFETTAPATAATVLQADREQCANFCVLMCHKLVVPAMEAMLGAPKASWLPAT